MKEVNNARPLTVARIEALEPRERRYLVSDAKVVGLGVRVFPSGAKSFYVRGRKGKGRSAKRIEVHLGAVGTITLKEARERAQDLAREMREGSDPRVRLEAQIGLGDLIDLYEKRLIARQVVKRTDMVSALRRGLSRYLNRSAEDITRRQIVTVLDRMEASGRAGAAQYLRKTLTAMLNWAVGADHLKHNVLGGYRRERSTKAETAARAKTTFTTGDEIRAFWHASAKVKSAVFRDFMRFLLMVGTRRTETAAMEWSQVALGNERTWVIPAAQTKMGREHQVYLGAMSCTLLDAQPRYNATGLVFAGRRLMQMSGWSKLLAPMKTALGDDSFSFHALRRTYRTGLAELGVPFDVAELMVGHARSDLHQRYDKSTLQSERRNAQERWEVHLAQVVGA